MTTTTAPHLPTAFLLLASRALGTEGFQSDIAAEAETLQGIAARLAPRLIGRGLVAHKGELGTMAFRDVLDRRGVEGLPEDEEAAISEGADYGVTVGLVAGYLLARTLAETSTGGAR